MTELEHFQRLKEKVLLKYQEYYPFFNGNWKSFSSQDIVNLIDLIEKNCKQTISEKWIYTHLKPENNSKIPRKDMLNILCEFVGFSGWDEFIFEEKNGNKLDVKKSKISKKWLLLLLLPMIFAVVYFYKKETPKSKTIELKNEFTNEKIKSDEVKVFQIEDSSKQELNVDNGKIEIKPNTNNHSKIIIKSPYYKTKTLKLDSIVSNKTNSNNSEITLKPDDYAMMLKAFLLSDIKDWKTRKEQLNTILSDNLEVIVMLKNDLGSEYFNKNEFSQKLIIPTDSNKKMKIIEINNDENNKIQFIRIKQE